MPERAIEPPKHPRIKTSSSPFLLVRNWAGAAIIPTHLMTYLKKWIDQPRSVWLRRAMFQIHLWTGLAIGLYIVMMSVSGSILVYNAEIVRFLEAPMPEFQPDREPMSVEEMTVAAERAYPGYEVTRIGRRVTRRRPVMSVDLELGDDVRARVFNPYTGEDLGEAFPDSVRALFWVTELHDDLLMGFTGRRINGIGSALVTLLILTGAVIWWPGRKRVRRSLSVKWKSRWPRFNWDLHSALGFWVYALMLLWAVSGVYLAFPDPFQAVVDTVSNPDAILGDRPGDVALLWLTRLHFGRFRDYPALQAMWALLGLVPAVMFITGSVMWWNRVLRKVSGAPADETSGLPTSESSD